MTVNYKKKLPSPLPPKNSSNPKPFYMFTIYLSTFLHFYLKLRTCQNKIYFEVSFAKRSLSSGMKFLNDN